MSNHLMQEDLFVSQNGWCVRRDCWRDYLYMAGENDKKVDKVAYVGAMLSLNRIVELWMIILVGHIEQIMGEK